MAWEVLASGERSPLARASSECGIRTTEGHDIWPSPPRPRGEEAAPVETITLASLHRSRRALARNAIHAGLSQAALPPGRVMVLAGDTVPERSVPLLGHLDLPVAIPITAVTDIEKWAGTHEIGVLTTHYIHTDACLHPLVVIGASTYDLS